MSEFSRRETLAMSLGSLIMVPWAVMADGGNEAAKKIEAEEQQVQQEIEEKARKIGLSSLKVLKTDHFAIYGDVSDRFLQLVGQDCETVCDDFVRHFTSKGFTIKLPPKHLTVVALSEASVYAKYIGVKVGLSLGGHYDLKTDQLVVYDYRPARGQVNYRVGRLNLMVLAHEVTHQLCFHSGLLDRLAESPKVVIEGLGTYAEVRPTNSKSGMGIRNDMRLEDLAHLRRSTPWRPIKTLIENDDVFSKPPNGNVLLLGYAQAWLLVNFLMSRPDQLPGFRDYLTTLATRRDKTHRLEDAERHLGNLDQLDVELKQESIRLLKTIK